VNGSIFIDDLPEASEAQACAGFLIPHNLIVLAGSAAVEKAPRRQLFRLEGLWPSPPVRPKVPAFLGGPRLSG
jgi:hypothetical protein